MWLQTETGELILTETGEPILVQEGEGDVINDFIKIQRDQVAATEAADLLAWIRDMRSVYERGQRIRAKMQHAFSDASGAALIDWAPVQVLWGIPSSGDDIGLEANGQIVYTFIDGAVGSMEGSFQTNAAKTITERVG